LVLQVTHEKIPFTFHYTGCLIGIFSLRKCFGLCKFDLFTFEDVAKNLGHPPTKKSTTFGKKKEPQLKKVGKTRKISKDFVKKILETLRKT